MRNLDMELVAVQAIAAQLVTSGGGAVDSGNQDVQGYEGLLISMDFGAEHASDTLSGTNKVTCLLQHADDDGTGSPGSYANVAAADVVGVTPSSGVVYTVDAAADADQVVQFGYVGTKRFVKLTLTPAGTIANGLPVSVQFLKGFPHSVPAS